MTLTDQTITDIALGRISTDDLKSLPLDQVLAVKAAQIPQRRMQAHDVQFSSKNVDETRTISFVASDETPDRMGDIIRVAGWDLTNFKNNPVILWNHDSHDRPPIGKAVNIRKGEKRGGGAALIADIEFADKDIYPFADTVFQLVKRGFVKANSVGFLGSDVHVPESADERKALGLGEFGVLFNGAELLENSVVSVPANPAALQLALNTMLHKGIIRQDDADSFVYDLEGGEPGDWFERTSKSFVDFNTTLAELRAAASEDEDEEEDDEEEMESKAEAPEETKGMSVTCPECGATFDAAEERSAEELTETVEATEPGADVSAPAEASATVDEMVSVASHAPEHRRDADAMLAASLAMLLEQQAGQAAAMRQLVDAVADLSRTVVDLAETRTVSDGEGTASDDKDATIVDDLDPEAVEGLARSLATLSGVLKSAR